MPPPPRLWLEVALDTYLESLDVRAGTRGQRFVPITRHQVVGLEGTSDVIGSCQSCPQIGSGVRSLERSELSVLGCV